MTKRAPRACLAAALLALAPACSSLSGEDEAEAGWVAGEVHDGPPRRDLLRACEWALLRAGFPLSDRDEVSGRVTSGWDLNLAPYSRRGTRARAVAEVSELAAPGAYRVRVRVEVERNMEVHRPLEPAEADWEEAGFDAGRARLVLQHVLLQVRQPG